MVDPVPPVERRDRGKLLWLATTGAGAILAIGILWSLRAEATLCPAIYPSPPNCGVDGGVGLALVPMVLIVFGYAAIFACVELVAPRWRTLVLALLAGALGLIFVVGVVVVLASGATPEPIYY